MKESRCNLQITVTIFFLNMLFMEVFDIENSVKANSKWKS